MTSTTAPTIRVAHALRIAAAMDAGHIQEIESLQPGVHFFAMGEAEADRFSRTFKAEYSMRYVERRRE